MNSSFIQGGQQPQVGKIVPKHIRHVSGPTIQNAPYHQQPLSGGREFVSIDQKRAVVQSANVSGPTTISAVQNQSTIHRPKQTMSGLQIGHNRTNSNKISVPVEKLAQGPLDGAKPKNPETYQDYSKSFLNSRQFAYFL